MRPAARDDAEQAFGEWLLALGRIEPATLARARQAAAQTGLRLTQTLARLGIMEEPILAEHLARHLGLPLRRKERFPDGPLAGLEVTTLFLREHGILPLERGDTGLTVAVAEPLDDYPARALRVASGLPITVEVGLGSEIQVALDAGYGSGAAVSGITGGDDEGGEGATGSNDLERLRDLASGAPVIRLVNLMIERAVEQRASDIHLEPTRAGLSVRYRIDGELQRTQTIQESLSAPVLTRLKIIARLDIAERRLPQDGRIGIVARGREVDLRVSTVPMIHGEGVVLRILDRSGTVLELERLGLDAENLLAFRDILRRPNGVLLVTGPTGSGKTSTLYASLAELRDETRKIITVEDPVEYELAGINQIQVRSQIGLDFAKVLRSVLRHDPDIIMIGEIRDEETAAIAVQAALTGHLVLSTLHTNSAAGAIARLRDMGIQPYLITSTVNGIAAQRLVRQLCPDCALPFVVPPEVVRSLALDQVAAAPFDGFRRPNGCAACRGTGYRGRGAIVEVLRMSEAIRHLVLRDAGIGEIERAAMAEGMTSLMADGLAKAARGLTTIEEVLRVARGGD